MRVLWVLFTLASLASLFGAASYIILAWADVEGRAARDIPLVVWLIGTIAAPVLGAAALLATRKIWAVVPYLVVAVIAGQVSLAILVGTAMGPLSPIVLLGLLALNSAAAYVAWWLFLRRWRLATPTTGNAIILE